MIFDPMVGADVDMIHDMIRAVGWEPANECHWDPKDGNSSIGDRVQSLLSLGMAYAPNDDMGDYICVLLHTLTQAGALCPARVDAAARSASLRPQGLTFRC